MTVTYKNEKTRKLCEDGTTARKQFGDVAARQLRKRVRALLERRIAPYGLDEPELAMLWACIASPPGGRGQSDLADFLAVSPAQVSAVVKRLGQAGLLQGRIAADRRRRLWEPTPAGADLWRSIAESIEDPVLHRGAA